MRATQVMGPPGSKSSSNWCSLTLYVTGSFHQRRSFSSCLPFTASLMLRNPGEHSKPQRGEKLKGLLAERKKKTKNGSSDHEEASKRQRSSVMGSTEIARRKSLLEVPSSAPTKKATLFSDGTTPKPVASSPVGASSTLPSSPFLSTVEVLEAAVWTMLEGVSPQVGGNSLEGDSSSEEPRVVPNGITETLEGVKQVTERFLLFVESSCNEALAFKPGKMGLSFRTLEQLVSLEDALSSEMAPVLASVEDNNSSSSVVNETAALIALEIQIHLEAVQEHLFRWFCRLMLTSSYQFPPLDALECIEEMKHVLYLSKRFGEIERKREIKLRRGRNESVSNDDGDDVGICLVSLHRNPLFYTRRRTCFLAQQLVGKVAVAGSRNKGTERDISAEAHRVVSELISLYQASSGCSSSSSSSSAPDVRRNTFCDYETVRTLVSAKLRIPATSPDQQKVIRSECLSLVGPGGLQDVVVETC